MREDPLARHLARIEEAHKRSRDRLLAQQKRIEKRFETARERVIHGNQKSDDQRQNILNAALDLLDEDGLNSLSLRKLAGEVDLQAPALYWYFRSKESLIDYMAEEILRTEFKDLQPRKKDEPWQDWLIGICKRLRKAMLSRRDGARIVAGAHLNPAVTLMQIFEVSIGSLIEAGVDERRAGLIASTAIHFVFGRVIEEQNSPTMAEFEQYANAKRSSFLDNYPYMAREARRTIADMKKGYDEFDDALRLIIGQA